MPAVATIPSKRAVKVSEVAATKVAAPTTDVRKPVIVAVGKPGAGAARRSAAGEGATPDKAEPKSAIITARKPRARSYIDMPDLTEEEINRRADAAEALFREIQRRSGIKV